MFEIFDRRDKGSIGIGEIRQTFNQFLDVPISDQDIMEFIEEADTDNDRHLDKKDFLKK